MSRFADRLLAWYVLNQRSLPWRGHRDPYAVWVSEIMLQQTRVDAVIPYFLRWMRRFPSIPSLARSSERDVLRHWEGLGYYARARNFRRAAKIVMREYGGVLPADIELLRGLPGIGRYTAGAIASIAFGLDEPALDANIRRVLARLFDVSVPARSPAGERILWELARKHLSKGHAADYNQAMMDLGATICLPAKPRCPECPVRMLCAARKLGLQEKRPVLTPKKAVPHHIYTAAVILRRRRVLLAKRPSSGLLGGMWEFPNGKVSRPSPKELAKVMRSLYHLDVISGGPAGIVHHGYSHFTVDVHVFSCEASKVQQTPDLHWVSVDALDDVPMGWIDRRIARSLNDG